jgi:transcriptional regulator with XRE-family HTH domain
MAAISRKPTPLGLAFGETLRAARAGAGLSQEALGFACDIDRTYVSLLERGIKQPTLGTLFELCDQLGVKPETVVANTRKRLAESRGG